MGLETRLQRPDHRDEEQCESNRGDNGLGDINRSQQA